MAMTITDECVNCGACLEVCPREAIEEGDPHYTIDAGKCTECADEGASQCLEACPIEDCIVRAA